MTWISEHKRYLRMIYLLSFVIAISGPWFFDRIYVPSEYTCSAPNMRLDDEFCGLPLSITWFFSEIIGGLPYMLTGLAKGAPNFGDTSRQLLFFSFLFLLLLPVLSTAILILRGEHWQAPHRVGLGLAAGIGGWIAWQSYSKASWVLWGLWLYIGLTISLWALEVLLWKIPKRVVQG